MQLDPSQIDAYADRIRVAYHQLVTAPGRWVSLAELRHPRAPRR